MENVFEIVLPVIKPAVERGQRFDGLERRDMLKLYVPPLEVTCTLAGVDSHRAAAIVESWPVAPATLEMFQAAVSELTTPTVDLAAAQAKMAELTAEIEADLAAHPAVPDLQERHLPLAQRSRAALELRWEHTRCGGPGDNRYEHFLVDDELYKRNCALDGETYIKRDFAQEEVRRLASVIPGPRLGGGAQHIGY